MLPVVRKCGSIDDYSLSMIMLTIKWQNHKLQNDTMNRYCCEDSILSTPIKLQSQTNSLSVQWTSNYRPKGLRNGKSRC